MQNCEKIIVKTTKLACVLQYCILIFDDEYLKISLESYSKEFVEFERVALNVCGQKSYWRFD